MLLCVCVSECVLSGEEDGTPPRTPCVQLPKVLNRWVGGSLGRERKMYLKLSALLQTTSRNLDRKV